MRILNLSEAKEIDADFIYKEGNVVAIVSKKFVGEWNNDEWKKQS